jgi:ketosteroid isomerase-like protein
MSVEENMALARRFLEAHFKGDLDAMDEMMTPDFVGHTKLLPDQVPTREGQKMGLRSILCRRLQPQHTLRGPDSSGRQGGHPLHRACNP